jgi:hypothetical protein
VQTPESLLAISYMALFVFLGIAVNHWFVLGIYALLLLGIRPIRGWLAKGWGRLVNSRAVRRALRPLRAYTTRRRDAPPAPGT